jgi:hypothetical protein
LLGAKTGNIVISTSPSAAGNSAARAAHWASRKRWVRFAPLGSPEEPVVKVMRAGSSAETGWTAATSAPSSRSASEHRAGQGPRCQPVVTVIGIPRSRGSRSRSRWLLAVPSHARGSAKAAKVAICRRPIQRGEPEKVFPRRDVGEGVADHGQARVPAGCRLYSGLKASSQRPE